MKKRYNTLVAAMLLLTANITFAQVSPEEFDALKALYKSTNGGSWTNSSGWDTTKTANDVTSPSWFGLTVSGGHVTGINLNTNNLSGPLPVEIGNFPNLTGLYLYINEISGSIPQEIGNLSSLVYCYLQSNQLSGDIPITIGNLTNLQYLSLTINQLTTIPTTIGNLNKLASLWLAGNLLSGNLPSEIYNLYNLSTLDLYNNNLSGTILSSIGNLGKLEELYLSNNNFTGSIPSSIGNLAKLDVLKLDSNQLSGTIPESLGSIGTLTGLDISSNKYTYEELEAVIDTLPDFTEYAPQDSLPVAQEVYNLTEGDALELTLATGGEYNQYEWYKGTDWTHNLVSSLSGSPDFTIPAVALSSAGEYHCRVSNTRVPLYLYIPGSRMYLLSKAIYVNVEEDTSTAVEQNTVREKTSLFPNPTTGKAYLEGENIHRVTIQNTAGQTIYARQANGENPVQIDLSGQPAGMYLVVVETGEGVIRKRLVVLNN